MDEHNAGAGLKGCWNLQQDKATHSVWCELSRGMSSKKARQPVLAALTRIC